MVEIKRNLRVRVAVVVSGRFRVKSWVCEGHGGLVVRIAPNLDSGDAEGLSTHARLKAYVARPHNLG